MKLTKLCILLFVLSSLAFAEDVDVSGSFEEGVTGSIFEIISSWQALAMAAIMLSAILVAIGYMIGIGFELPELKAWAGTELGQVIANAFLVIALILTITFLDGLVLVMVNASGTIHCDIGESCLKEIVVSEHGYLHDYVETAKDSAKDVLQNNMEAAAWTRRRTSLGCISIYCAMASFTMGLAPQYQLDTDRYLIVYEYWVNVLSSLHAQLFFVDQISFNVGPLLLAIGVVARSFFFSRKAGGLLIAIAAGIMFFLPMMYVFDWMTLDMVVAGDNAIEDDVQGCPAECGELPATVYYYNTTGDLVSITNTNEIYYRFTDSEEDEDAARRLARGESDEETGTLGDAEGRPIFNCHGPAAEDCPVQCRELPYPHGLSDCVPYDVQLACSQLPEECKVVRLVPSAIEDPEYLMCPEECKIIPPLKSDCSDGGSNNCLKSRFDCRMTMIDDRDWRPEVEGPDDKVEACERAEHCVAPEEGDNNAYESCVYIMPRFGSCDDLCLNCPPQCRLTNADPENLPDDCFVPPEWGGEIEKTDDNLLPLCLECPDTCKVNIDIIRAMDGEIAPACSECDFEHRLIYSTLPSEQYYGGGCAPTECPTDFEHRVEIPRSSCQSCLYSEESYLYNPPIYKDCATLCKPSNKVPTQNSIEYSKIDEDGLVGKPDIKNISKFMIPAFLLPLFNIVATLIFIKGFSAMLGGDIEIPGLRKIF